MIDEPTTTVTIRRHMRDRTEDHYDPDQTAEAKIVASGVRANISVPTNSFVQGTKEVTTYRFFADPLDAGRTIVVGDQLIDERTEQVFSIAKALLRVDPDYPDELCEPRSLTHIVGEVVASKGASRGAG